MQKDGINARSYCWLLVCVLVIPVLVASLYGYTALLTLQEAELGVQVPAWLRNVLSFGVLAGVLLGLGYAAARFMNRLFPGTPVRSASWDDSPGMVKRDKP